MRPSNEVLAKRGTQRPGARVAGAVALVLMAFLGGCGGSGFQPLYGSAGIGGAQADQRLAQVEIATIPSRVGQVIRNELIFHTTGGGTPAPPVYNLDIAIRETVTSTLVKTDGNAQSEIYNLEAKFKLIRLSDKQVVLEGTSYGRAGFERFTSVFSNVRAREDAENRAARTVADDIKARLSAYLAGAA